MDTLILKRLTFQANPSTEKFFLNFDSLYNKRNLLTLYNGDLMSDEYPEKTCDIDRLLRHPKLVAAALAGKKTQQRRDGIYAYPGETFQLQDVQFIVTDLTREKLGDMTEQDAIAEGYPGLDAYKDLILRMHQGMDWNPDHLVWVHRFEIDR